MTDYLARTSVAAALSLASFALAEQHHGLDNVFFNACGWLNIAIAIIWATIYFRSKHS